MSDGEVSKLLIVTQTPQRPKKHEGFDRSADSVSRVKMSQVNTILSFYIRYSRLPPYLICSLAGFVNSFFKEFYP